MQTIHEAIRKDLISENLAQQYSAVFAKCADWFAPNNRRNDEYGLAQDLHKIGLLDMRRTSKHRAGCFRGYRVEFKQSAAAAGAA